MTPEKANKYADIAHAISQLSKDQSSKVGAIVLGPDYEIRSLGYNGAHRGCRADEDERGRNRPEKYFWFSHAELNAITNAARVGVPLKDCSIIVTHFPCMDCARAIVQAGITEVWVVSMDAEYKARWKEHTDRAVKLFAECGIRVGILR